MDIYVIDWIDQFCDYDTKLNLRQINRVCHTELPQLIFKLNDSDPNYPKPLSYVLTLSPNEIANVSLISWMGTSLEICDAKLDLLIGIGDFMKHVWVVMNHWLIY